MPLSLQNLTAGYAQGPDIIHEVNLELHEGEIVTLIGPNGAGKSTVLRSIFGLTEIRKGQIFHGAREITHLPTHSIIKSGIAFVTQGMNIFPDLSVEENLDMGAFTLRNQSEIKLKKESVFQFFPKLKLYRKKNAGLLSGGERQMVALGMGLMLSPEVLLLDEPSIGLSPKVIEEVFEKIQHIKESGTSILMVEQNAAKALSISDRAYVLENGHIALEGRGETLLQDKRVGALYLGHER